MEKGHGEYYQLPYSPDDSSLIMDKLLAMLCVAKKERKREKWSKNRSRTAFYNMFGCRRGPGWVDANEGRPKLGGDPFWGIADLASRPSTSEKRTLMQTSPLTVTLYFTWLCHRKLSHRMAVEMCFSLFLIFECAVVTPMFLQSIHTYILLE